MKDSEVRLHQRRVLFHSHSAAEVTSTWQVAYSHVKLNQGELHTMTMKYHPLPWLFHLKPPGKSALPFLPVEVPTVEKEQPLPILQEFSWTAGYHLDS